MAKRSAIQSATDAKRQRAWELHLKGADQFAIAAELGCTQARVSQLIKDVAAAHPINKLSLEERLALSESRWEQAEKELKEEINEQRRNGRIVEEILEFPDGTKQRKITRTQGVEHGLLRAYSTHTDRRARQLSNQISPDAGVQQVNVNVVRDFLGQGDKPAARLSADEWNEQAIDV